MKYVSPNHADKKVLRKNKILYYIDEISIFLISVIGVALSDVIQKATTAKITSAHDIFVSWPQLLVSSLIAIVVYGSMYTKWKYNDENKPPWIKRAANSLAQGIAWRTIINLGNTK